MHKVCGPSVDTFSNWTPTYEWYMARFVIKNTKKTFVMLRLDYVLIIYQPFQIRFNSTIEKAYVVT